MDVAHIYIAVIKITLVLQGGKFIMSLTKKTNRNDI